MGVVFLGSCRSMATSLGGSRRLAVARQRLDVGLQLLPRGQRPVPEQVHDLLERGVLDEIVDVVAAIEQAPLAPVDEADLGGRNDHVLEASLELPLAHTIPSPLRCENGFFYHTCRSPSRRAATRDGGHLDFYDRHPDQRGPGAGRAWPAAGRARRAPLAPTISSSSTRITTAAWPRSRRLAEPGRHHRRLARARRVRRARRARALPGQPAAAAG